MTVHRMDAFGIDPALALQAIAVVLTTVEVAFAYLNYRRKRRRTP